MSNEIKEILEKVYEAQDRLEGLRVILRPIENTLNRISYILENTKKKKFDDIEGLFDNTGNSVDKDYLLNTLNDKLGKSVEYMGEVFETMPLLLHSKKLIIKDEEEDEDK